MTDRPSEAEHYVAQAIALALDNVRTGKGGPFGALVVSNGVVVAAAANQVVAAQDPTAHAEILAIRRACQRLGRFELTGATLYASCEPCPMCLGAIYWARMQRIYYAACRQDAARAGFDDARIYAELAKEGTQRSLKLVRVPLVEGAQPFQAWDAAARKQPY